jgi:hypothetical protein
MSAEIINFATGNVIKDFPQKRDRVEMSTKETNTSTGEVEKEESSRGMLFSIPEERHGKVHGFGEMEGFFPDSLGEGEMNFLKEYFRVQIKIQKGRRKRAKEKMDGLADKTGWNEFEEQNKELLAMIDIAVRGETRQFDTSGYPMGFKREPKSVK